MSNFQILGISVAVALAILTLLAVWRNRISRLSAVGWFLLWLAAATTIARPMLTVAAARALGIDRGADLVFYCAILAMLVGFFTVYGRLRKTDQALTKIVRRLALLEADRAETCEEL